MKYLFHAAFAACMTCAASAHAQNPIVIKFSHVGSVDSPKGLAAERFKEVAETKLAGKIRVDVYPNSQLYKDKEELEALQLGAVEMLAPVVGKFGPAGLKDFQAFDLPYLFPDVATLHKITRGPIGKKLMHEAETKGMVGLAFWDNGFRSLSANRPLHLPSDVKGLKIRINSSRVNMDMIRALGGMPQVMPYSEVYQALQTGVVDGTDGPISNLYTSKQYEVQSHVTLTEQSFSGYMVVVNKRFWDGLAPDIRAGLEAAMADATVYNDQVAEEDENKALREIQASGKSEIYRPTPAEKQEWVKALMPVQEKMARQLGVADFVKAVRTELAAQ